MFSFRDSWWLFLLIIVIAQFIYYWLLKKEQPKKTNLLFLVYSEILVLTGFLNLLILENGWVINGFLVFWSILYFFYLEGYFHYLYPNPKASLFNLKDSISYLNLIIVFFLIVTLVNFNIFLDLSWWWIIPLTFIINLFLIHQIFSLEGDELKSVWPQVLIIDLLLTELLLALSFWPVSFYTVAAVYSLAYYWLISFALMSRRKTINRQTILKYLALGLIILVLILSTSKWI